MPSSSQLVLFLIFSCSGNVKADNLNELRSHMVRAKLDAYIIPYSDYHGSEMPADRDKRLEWLSGFTGSYGDAVVTLNDAALFTDSRYTIQARRQLSEAWEVPPKDLNMSAWITKKLKAGDRIGADPKTMAFGLWLSIQNKINDTGIELEKADNFIDMMWKDQPILPDVNLFKHSVHYTGKDYTTKVSEVRQTMVDTNSSVLVLTSLDEIAWLLNLRGGDSEYTPIFSAFVILGRTNATLYVRQNIVTDEIKDHLNSTTAQFRIKNYEDFWEDWTETASNCWKCFVPTNANYFVYSAVAEDRRKSGRSPVIDLRAYKTDTEVEATRRAHVSDAIALCRLFSTLEEQIGSKSWSEMEVSELAGKFRSEEPENRGRSFPDIVAAGSNAALPHYRPLLGSDAKVNDSSIVLLDTGGQYLGGTTDVTRVLHLGDPRPVEVDVYSRLLKGVSRLGATIFPQGSNVKVLDSLIRAPLYQVGLDYGHGSTHGVGIFLSVHEAFNGSYYKHFIGSQEPGYYEENNFGMRLENLVVVVPAETTYKNKTTKPFLKFSPLTLVPYEKKLINASIFDESELEWVNSYHKDVLRIVGGEILKRGDQKLYHWLAAKTEMILKK